MNVLVINGSPKGDNSNTIKLTRSFLEGAGWSNADIVNISRTDIKGCMGCYACWQKTPGRCVLNDGMEAVLNKLIAADIVIWSFPLYYFSVPGSLKNLIDRQLPLNLPFMEDGSSSGGHPSRYDFSKQRHILISTCGFWTAKGNYDAVSVLFDRYYGIGDYETIFCGQGELFRVPELRSRTDKYLAVVRQAGAQYAAGGILKETRDELERPILPREVFEKMADASWDVVKVETAKPRNSGDGLGVSSSSSTDSGIGSGAGDDDGGDTSKNLNPTPESSLNFTKQMAALYSPDGVERVLEFYYTDIDKTYQILMTKSGSEVITDGFKKYSTRIETPYALWQAIARGEVSGQDALFQRQYKVLGDFGLMLKWDELFGATDLTSGVSHDNHDVHDSRESHESHESRESRESHAKRKTRRANMLVLLLPWILFWSLIPISVTYGVAITIMASASLPFAWIFFQSNIYEKISISIATGLSLAVSLGASSRVIVPLSYLAFGLMWIAGAYAKTPLTAYYSAAEYGRDKAFSNPLFVRTNRILTAAWGALYLLTSIWTYVLMGTGLSAYSGLINSVCPLLMGVFTAWFQRWYPARWARM